MATFLFTYLVNTFLGITSGAVHNSLFNLGVAGFMSVLMALGFISDQISEAKKK